MQILRNKLKKPLQSGRNRGEPDIVINRCEITKAYPNIDVDDYVAVKRVYFYKPYKFTTNQQYITIYMKKRIV